MQLPNKVIMTLANSNVTWNKIFPVAAKYPDIKSCGLRADTGMQETPLTQVVSVAVPGMLE